MCATYNKGVQEHHRKQEQRGFCGLQRKVNLSKGASDQKMAWGRLRGLGTHCQALQKANPSLWMENQNRVSVAKRAPPGRAPERDTTWVELDLLT